jgi:phytoene synthase
LKVSGAATLPAAPPAGSPRWYAWLFTPRRERVTIALLFALESELRSVIAPHVDHGVAHLKLLWWREEIQRLSQSEPRHPLTRSLAAAVTHAADVWQPLADFLTSLELEFAAVAIDDEAELERFLALADGLARTMALAVAGDPADGVTLQTGANLGQAVRGVQLAADWCRTPMDAHRRAAVLRLAARSRARWELVLQSMNQPGHEALRGMRVLGRLHMAMLDHMESNDYRANDQSHALPPMQSLWTAWRAARQH